AGPVDPIRWGSALARVSRLTEIPAADLHRRFAAKPAAGPRRSITAPAKPQVPAARPPDARQRAERWMLGALLAEPRRWHSVQQEIGPQDFNDELHRKVAQVYWDYQRDEGEPVFNEFLGELREDALAELVIEVTQEVEEFGNLDRALESALAYFREYRRRRYEGWKDEDE